MNIQPNLHFYEGTSFISEQNISPYVDNKRISVDLCLVTVSDTLTEGGEKYAGINDQTNHPFI